MNAIARNFTRCRFVLIIVLCLGLTAVPAHAWSVAGHMASGAIAYQVLKADSPETLAKVVALLKKHPDYERRWARRLEAPNIPEDQRDLYLFMLATRWADDIRKKRRDDHPNWHFVNFPFKPD